LLIVKPGTAIGKPRLDQRLTRRVLAGTGRENLPHDDFADLFGLYARAFERSANHDGAEIGCGGFRQRPTEFTHCRTRGRYDHYISHFNFLRTLRSIAPPPVKLKIHSTAQCRSRPIPTS
jgi:hypothetical protein